MKKVYSAEWFSGLAQVDGGLHDEMLGLIRARRSSHICLVCKVPARRDYAIVGAKLIAVLRLCPCCRGFYAQACAPVALLPFVGRLP